MVGEGKLAAEHWGSYRRKKSTKGEESKEMAAEKVI
jgi:stalled ribosome alternative rescue factor ArfA